MVKYTTRRLLLFIPSLIGVSLIIFAIMRVLPGDVALQILTAGGAEIPSEEELQEFRHELGVDRALPVQYWDWARGWFTGDLGTSLWTGESVVRELSHRFPVTLQLAFLSILVSTIIAVPLGVLAALRQDTWIDHVARLFAVAGLAMPNFWLGTLIILALVIAFAWVPPYEFRTFWQDPVVSFQQLIFPALALGYSYAAIMSRMTRSSMLEVLRQDYMRTAWAKGLAPRVIIIRHAVKNALLPVVTVAGIEMGNIIGGSVILESIFVLPGIGKALVDSIMIRDYILVQSLIILLAFGRMFANLVVDLTYAWLDPRVKYG